MGTTVKNNLAGQLKSTGFIDGYKASNFESNSSFIKYHEEELSDLLKLLQESLFKIDLGESKALLESTLRKAHEKLISVRNFSEAEDSYIQSFSFFESFLNTIKELNIELSPTNMLLIKKILHHYKMLGEKALLDNLTTNSKRVEISFLTLK